MKKVSIVLMLLLTLCFTSCVSLLPKPHSYSSCIDYGYLSQQGVFITESNSVSFDYQPLGSLYVECTGGWDKKRAKLENSEMEDIYMEDAKNNSYVPATIEEAFDLALAELDRLKGNGIINFKISTVTEYLPSYKISVNKIILTGMCIKK